ncbi:MAG: hypothetical protein LUE89_11290 [Clostridiales bacterium]|nr:hypothetical protein [Clostridiales bacterium]
MISETKIRPETLEAALRMLRAQETAEKATNPRSVAGKKQAAYLTGLRSMLELILTDYYTVEIDAKLSGEIWGV